MRPSSWWRRTIRKTARLVDMYLRRDGYRVYKAVDGATGLDRIEQYRPKLVILDIGLPGDVDGIQLCRELRATSESPSSCSLPATATSAGSWGWNWAPMTK